MDDKNKKSVLMISTSFPLRKKSVCGIFVRNLANAMQKYVNISVVCPADQFTSEEPLAIPVRYAPRSWRRFYNNDGGVATFQSLFSLALAPLLFVTMLITSWRAARRSDAIIGHWSFSGVIAGICGRLLRKPSLVYYRGSDINRINDSASLKLLFRLSAHFCQKVVFVSDSLRDEIKLDYPSIYSKSIVIQNGISEQFTDNRAANSIQSQCFKFLAVGSLIPVKDYVTLIKAVEHLCARFDNFSVTIIGSGPAQKEIELMCERAGLNKIVTLISSVPNDEIFHYYQEADALIHTSLAEGRSGVICEALCCGLPVIRSRIAANEHLFNGCCEQLSFEARNFMQLSELMNKIAHDFDFYNSQRDEARRLGNSIRCRWDDTAIKVLNQLKILTPSV